MLLLVRPNQPRIVAGTGRASKPKWFRWSCGSPKGEIRRVAVVRAAGSLLRVFVPDRPLAVGEHVRVQIEGQCDPLTGEMVEHSAFYRSRTQLKLTRSVSEDANSLPR